jgi:hypothetical protein
MKKYQNERSDIVMLTQRDMPSAGRNAIKCVRQGTNPNVCKDFDTGFICLKYSTYLYVSRTLKKSAQKPKPPGLTGFYSCEFFSNYNDNNNVFQPSALVDQFFFRVQFDQHPFGTT